MCPQCEIELKSWNDLSKEEQDHIRDLGDRGAQSMDHRMDRHLFCPACYYEAHG